MVKFINHWTGTEMLVADNRVEEYKAVGHKLAASEVKAVVPVKEPAKEPEKRAVKKATKRKR